MPQNTAKLIKHTQLTSDIFELTFETETNLNFKAGQFITIKIADKAEPCFRGYSISSAPQNNKGVFAIAKTNLLTTHSAEAPCVFDICVKTIKNGRGSNWLNNLQIGEKINFIGPTGKFTFSKTEKNTIFIATGTGVAPFKSILEDELKNKNTKNKITLLWGLRNTKSIFYENFLNELKKNHENFSFTITLSDQENHIKWSGKKGRVTDFLLKTKIDPENTETYLCGLKEMIEEVSAILQKKGLPKKAIHFEQYD